MVRERPASETAGERRRRPSGWALLVVVSVVVLLAASAGMAALWAATTESRRTSYRLPGALIRVEIDVDTGNVDVLGGGKETVQILRAERYAYDHPPKERRTMVDGVLRIESRCPVIILGSCSVDYRLTVPDNVPVTVLADTGDVRLTSFRGSAQIDADTGNVSADAFCGFALRATANTGDIRVNAACAPDRLELRTSTGDVSAAVPFGRYRIEADTDTGETAVRGLTRTDDAPWSIQALSNTGDVTIEAVQ